MAEQRGIDAAVADAIARSERLLRPYVRAYGPVVDVTFPAAASARDVVHQLGATPTGFHVVWADGPVYAEPGVPWDRTLAWLRASNVNTHARVVFFTCLGDADET